MKIVVVDYEINALEMFLRQIILNDRIKPLKCRWNLILGNQLVLPVPAGMKGS